SINFPNFLDSIKLTALKTPQAMRRIPVSDIEQRVKQAVAEQLGIKIEEIKNEASFMDDLGADSLDLVELVMSFENDFDITIPDEDSNELTTVQSAIDYVSKKFGYSPISALLSIKTTVKVVFLCLQFLDGRVLQLITFLSPMTNYLPAIFIIKI